MAAVAGVPRGNEARPPPSSVRVWLAGAEPPASLACPVCLEVCIEVRAAAAATPRALRRVRCARSLNLT
jgi:hypothetical protein